MFKKIKKPATCEMQSNLFLEFKNMKLADIHHQICGVYGDGLDTLMKDAKMFMMIHWAADRL
jgi:hypothetical protein